MTVSCGLAKARDLSPTHTHTHISAPPLNHYLTTHIHASLSAGCQSFISAAAGPVGDATLALIRIGSCQRESGAAVQYEICSVGHLEQKRAADRRMRLRRELATFKFGLSGVRPQIPGFIYLCCSKIPRSEQQDWLFEVQQFSV